MVPEFNHCKSCGMPMMNEQDHGGNDENNSWCKYCCDNNGNHKSYDEILENMTNFMLSEDGQMMSGIKFENKEDALKSAKDYLSKCEAWEK